MHAASQLLPTIRGASRGSASEAGRQRSGNDGFETIALVGPQAMPSDTDSVRGNQAEPRR